jgi:serine/threonine protein phosphatase 1
MVALVSTINGNHRLDQVVHLTRIEDGPTYAVGDVHGCATKLRKLLKLVRDDAAEREIEKPRIVFIGDYIDRGPDSYGTLEILEQCRNDKSIEALFLYGNHENMMLNSIYSSEFKASWDRNGGVMTVESFLDHGASVKEAMIRFKGLFEVMEFGFETSSHVFVHAGLNPRLPRHFQRVVDVLWTRYQGESTLSSKTVVHGHTIVGTTPVVTSGRVMIDTGAFKGGPLTAVFIEGADASPRFIQT